MNRCIAIAACAFQWIGHFHAMFWNPLKSWIHSRSTRWRVEVWELVLLGLNVFAGWRDDQMTQPSQEWGKVFYFESEHGIWSHVATQNRTARTGCSLTVRGPSCSTTHFPLFYVFPTHITSNAHLEALVYFWSIYLCRVSIWRVFGVSGTGLNGCIHMIIYIYILYCLTICVSIYSSAGI